MKHLLYRCRLCGTLFQANKSSKSAWNVATSGKFPAFEVAMHASCAEVSVCRGIGDLVGDKEIKEE